MSHRGKFEVYERMNQDPDVSKAEVRREWGWRLKGGNGEVVASGEGYTRPDDAERAVRAVKRLSLLAKIERAKEALMKKWAVTRASSLLTEQVEAEYFSIEHGSLVFYPESELGGWVGPIRAWAPGTWLEVEETL